MDSVFGLSACLDFDEIIGTLVDNVLYKWLIFQLESDHFGQQKFL